MDKCFEFLNNQPEYKKFTCEKAKEMINIAFGANRFGLKVRVLRLPGDNHWFERHRLLKKIRIASRQTENTLTNEDFLCCSSTFISMHYASGDYTVPTRIRFTSSEAAWSTSTVPVTKQNEDHHEFLEI
ncbi:hypothetical protein KIN20_017116 [Parelaphostrongylus tenuis]|uniref:Uncharacterized protein n=1 Tax=Parelaphostrongylus tenuis TaxID=148309 RepID=A0AAD5N2Q4_PARTN|nr:hypothetical protein KIN20_017116 [Parelaphostrongylus tenuis]